jgi:carbon starvation protein
MVVVKALGGEEIKLAAGTKLQLPSGQTAAQIDQVQSAGAPTRVTMPAGTTIIYPNGSSVPRSEAFTLVWPTDFEFPLDSGQAAGETPLLVTVPAGVTQSVPGSSWGTFTIACTIPIALFTGLYMYKIRKGSVVEASAIGAIAVLVVTVLGNWIPGSALEPYFSLSRGGTIWAICLYGFIASVLPVWMLLCPRDYLSSFLKIGTVVLLVVGVILANPELKAPSVNEHFAREGGPTVPGPLFPFVFICIMCGAISGFHALVSSGTSPKMISQESHVRLIGYGSMLIEGLVGVVALIAASSLPQGDYWAINIDLSKVEKYADTLKKMQADTDDLPEIERQVGGESLRGRTGGAVTLAVGISQIFTNAMRRVAGTAASLESIVKYWYHFAIMFEALFILTTIDTGTRIARFLLQESLGKIYKPFDRTDWLPGAVISTAAVTAAWGWLIKTGSIDTIWPMFGIANQLLAVIALSVVTTVMINAGRARYAPLTILPMLFVTSTTMTAGYMLVTGPFLKMLEEGRRVQGTLNIALSIFMMVSVLIILTAAVTRWTSVWRGRALLAAEPATA